MNERRIDSTVRRLRSEISEVDRAILAVVNTRIELVTHLKRHKDAVGLPFLDPDRERELIDELGEKNAGPLSPDGLRELYAYLIDLTKREVTRDGRSP
ncbi:MAG TPA: chorismate mutase [Gaiellaceae bacterium]|nr:chorismate mutase [Gaiellaceae bacterium]